MHRNKSDTTKYPHGKPPLTPTPGGVSAESTTHPITHELGDASSAPPPKDVDMVAGIKADLVTIRETFDLGEVPKEAYVLGLAGTLPYLGTSLATVFCAWDINYAEAHGTGWLLNEQSAETLLHLLEPLQVGYGAVVRFPKPRSPEFPSLNSPSPLLYPRLTHLSPPYRSSPSSVPSTGASNGQATAVDTATRAT